MTTTPPRDSAYKWWVVFMLWFVCFFNYADRQAISSVLPLLEKQFGFDKVQLSLIGSAFAWVYAGLALPAGLMADRFSRKGIILTACIVWSFFTLATAWCGTLTGFGLFHSLTGAGEILYFLLGFIVVRSLTGLGETLYFPAAMSLVSDYHSGKTRSSAMSWHQSAVYIGMILGSWLAAILAQRSGWATPFLYFGPCGILLAVVLFAFLREPKRGAADGGDDLTGHGPARSDSLSVLATLAIIARTPVAILLMAAFCLVNAVAAVFMVWAPTFLVEKFHYSLSNAAFTGTLYVNLASAIAVPWAGYLADRLARRYKAGRIFVQLGSLVLGSGFVFLVGSTNSDAILIGSLAVFGIFKGGYDSGIFASLYDNIEPRARGTAAGIMNTVGWGGAGFGIFVFGLAAKYGSHLKEWQNMSDAIAWGGAMIYLVGAAVLAVAAYLMQSRQTPSK